MNEWAAELYAHAIAIEREAASRYDELGDAMAERGYHAVAVLFYMLSSFEARHFGELTAKTAGVVLPDLTADYTWREGESPETVSFDACIVEMTPERALLLALDAEKRAKAFFEHAARITTDAPTRALAREMAVEEAEHIVLVERTLARVQNGGFEYSSVHEGL
jgi:rubrerythrin